MTFAYKKPRSWALLPLPTELADGLRLEGVSLKSSEIRPKMVGSSALNGAIDLIKRVNPAFRLGYPLE